jgi:NAD(P)-dependent dehydrogenase (short-subunit alcohol dehydrogenase family)
MTGSLSLAGKVALVTGAGSGIGRGIALRLAEAGARVAAGYVGEADGAQATIAMLEDANAGMTVPADIRVRGEVEAMIAEVLRRWDRLDFMVCNAGCYRAAPFLDTSEVDWRRVIDTNITGTFFCAQAAARAMIDRHSPGRIIIIASTQAFRPNMGPLAYGLSKAALLNMAQALGHELAPYRINVVCISPGVIEAAGNIAVLSNPAAREAIEAHIPAGRVGQPHDIGVLAAFLASDAASYITGTNITVDGGLLTTGPQI